MAKTNHNVHDAKIGGTFDYHMVPSCFLVCVWLGLSRFEYRSIILSFYPTLLISAQYNFNTPIFNFKIHSLTS